MHAQIGYIGSFVSNGIRNLEELCLYHRSKIVYIQSVMKGHGFYFNIR